MKINNEELKEKINDIFIYCKNKVQYKEHQNIKLPKQNEYLKVASLKCNSIANIIDNEIVETVDKKMYKIYTFSFLIPNGIEKSVDNENEDNLTVIINQMESDFKIDFIQQEKRMLKNNIEFFESLYQLENDENRKQSIMNRLRVMTAFNNQKYVNVFIWINEDNYKFEENAVDTLYLEQLVDEKLINFICRLNNGFID